MFHNRKRNFVPVELLRYNLVVLTAPHNEMKEKTCM